jgi:hypothetical protein
MLDTELPAGRELDARIARDVLRWTLPPYSSIVGQLWVDSAGGVHPEGPAPVSTDLAAAFALVDTLRARGWYLQLEEDDRVAAVQFNRADGRRTPWQYGTTRALAICRAALQTLDTP